MYSQNGEDLFLEKYLIDNKIFINPVFVDIGAFDGISDSNSLLFQTKYGYTRHLVDANEKVLLAGGDYEFINYKKGLFGALEIINYNWGLATVKTSKRKTKIYNKTCITLSEYYEKKGFDKVNDIGVLSLDIEGNEDLILLESFENSKVRPQIIIVEGNTKEAKTKLRNLLEKEYKEIAEISVNLIFIRKDYAI
jgi:hypothetical protein